MHIWQQSNNYPWITQNIMFLQTMSNFFYWYQLQTFLLFHWKIRISVKHTVLFAIWLIISLTNTTQRTFFSFLYLVSYNLSLGHYTKPRIREVSDYMHSMWYFSVTLIPPYKGIEQFHKVHFLYWLELPRILFCLFLNHTQDFRNYRHIF